MYYYTSYLLWICLFLIRKLKKFRRLNAINILLLSTITLYQTLLQKIRSKILKGNGCSGINIFLEKIFTFPAIKIPDWLQVITQLRYKNQFKLVEIIATKSIWKRLYTRVIEMMITLTSFPVSLNFILCSLGRCHMGLVH